MSEETKVIKLNIKKEPLTNEKLRTFKGLENLSEEEALETLLTIHKFTGILYEFLIEQQRKEKEIAEIAEIENNHQISKVA